MPLSNQGWNPYYSESGVVSCKAVSDFKSEYQSCNSLFGGKSCLARFKVLIIENIIKHSQLEIIELKHSLEEQRYILFIFGCIGLMLYD
nr:hypothetical protein Iba_chr02bCG14720 [Ipomoea batatas]